MSMLLRRYARFPQAHVSSVIITVLAVLLLALFFQTQLRDAYENISFTIDPSAARAYSYAERHFDASDPANYDVDRAEYFFRLAQMRDPNLPYLYHELARIDFLKGMFTQALANINIQIANKGDETPNSYYVRGLIEGYMGDYASAAADYEHFLRFDPYNWAGLNDYAWVLLKAGRSKDAFLATSKGLQKFPNNAWLLNSNAIALFEMGDLRDAKLQAQRAMDQTQLVTSADWLHAYPGNDPKIAAAGVEAFKKATVDNMHSIISATSTHALQ
jgi:tetratricopeptide (TPR) repeat protein